MIYPNLHAAADSLGRKLRSFAGHNIDPTHTSFCFNELAKAIGRIAKVKAIRSINFDAEIYVDGGLLPVFVTVKGEDIFSPVEILIRSFIPDCE